MSLWRLTEPGRYTITDRRGNFLTKVDGEWVLAEGMEHAYAYRSPDLCERLIKRLGWTKSLYVHDREVN